MPAMPPDDSLLRTSSGNLVGMGPVGSGGNSCKVDEEVDAVDDEVEAVDDEVKTVEDEALVDDAVESFDDDEGERKVEVEGDESEDDLRSVFTCVAIGGTVNMVVAATVCVVVI